MMNSFMNSSSLSGHRPRCATTRACLSVAPLSLLCLFSFAPSARSCTDDAWRSQQGERGEAKEGPASASQPSHDVQHCAVAFYVLVPHDPFARACQERFGSNGEHPFRMGVHDWGCGVPAEPDHGAPLRLLRPKAVHAHVPGCLRCLEDLVRAQPVCACVVTGESDMRWIAYVELDRLPSKPLKLTL